MTVNPIKTTTHPTLQELSKELGKFATVEGEDHLIYQSTLETINELLEPTLLLLNIYKDFSLFPKMAELNIDTIVIESTFSYQDKIQKVILGLLTLYKQTGWKPKKIINTMHYGLDKLFMLGKLLDIEIYQ
ncbi:MAG: hypothetical protein RBT59_11880, partial [Arcobacteraceae bacterium]|nr:hypothetical protein [Arcobacteraceae bacterium]